MSYLIFISFALCVSYFVLFLLATYFFQNKMRLPGGRSFYSLLFIVFISVLSVYVSYQIDDVDVSNRFLHAVGGGFTAFILCFLVAKDSGITINRHQFFTLSLLVVTTLGVANELLEYTLQNHTNINLVFANSINDTWLDLVSNTAGLLAASILTVPLIKKRN